MKKVLLVTGMIGSGKGTLTQYFQEKYGASIYRFSDPLHDILSDLQIPNTRENLGILSRSLRKNFGEDIMGKGVKEYIENTTADWIILEGIRRIEAMREFGDMIDAIIWIETSQEIRYQRIRDRWEKSGEQLLSMAEFEKQDTSETEQTLSPLRDTADIIIENTGTEAEFFAKVDEYTKNL